MKKLTLPKMAISMPLAVLAAAFIFFVNDTNFDKSTAATVHIEEAAQTLSSLNKLLAHLIDAETGQRAYLLTGEERYLEPYTTAIGQINQAMDTLHQLLKPYPDQLVEYDTMARQISRKLSELDLTVRMRTAGQEDAWKFVMMTNVGQEHMNVIRAQVIKLSLSSTSKMAQGKDQIQKTLELSRIGIALLALAGLLAFYMYLRQTKVLLDTDQSEHAALQRERDQMESLVKERTVNLAQLTTHLQNVREEERGDLARALHDELGSLLTAAKLDVARIKARLAVNIPEAEERFAHLSTTLNSVIAMTRRIVEDLRPSSLSHLGLKASLEILAREFAEHSGLTITTDLEDVDLSGSAQLTIYRLVQESLTNIGKYAQAQQVEIGLHNFDRYVTVSVKDNGKGFKLDSVGTSSHGLAGMRHRVEAAGGRLTIASSEGYGTLISSVLPKEQ